MAKCTSEELESELKGVVKALQDVGRHMLKGTGVIEVVGRFGVFAYKLAVFEMRLGGPPDGVTGWSQLQAKAKSLLPRFKQLSQSTGDLTDVSEYCCLLAISGKPDAALKELDSTPLFSDCWRWAAHLFVSRAREKSRIHQRAGRYAEALASQEEAMENLGPHSGDDLLYTRYAFLLEKKGRVKKAIPQYQRVCDLYPDSECCEVARAALDNLGALVAPSAKRFVDTYLTGRDYTEDRQFAIAALAEHKLPGALEALGGRLEGAQDWETSNILYALGNLGDKRAVPLLRGFVESGYSDSSLDDLSLPALKSLGALGDRSQVVWYLKKIKSTKGRDYFSWENNVLRKIHGGGPEISDKQLVDNTLFADAWLEWLGARQRLRLSD